MNSTLPLRKRKTCRRADALLNEARQRYRRLPLTARPASQPSNLLALFQPSELFELALCRRWPLSLPDLQWVTGRRPSPDATSATTTPVAEEGC